MQILTKDSSVTLYNTSFGEAYHSAKDGALQETLHKHILPALSLKMQEPILSVLDICFGLGFNTLCLVHTAHSLRFKGKIFIHSPELDSNLLPKLLKHPYPKELENELAILESLIIQHYYKEQDLEIVLYLGNAREILKNFLARDSKDTPYKIAQNLMHFNIIFQDAFSPTKNRDLWTYEYFKTLYAISAENTLITTYSHHSCMLYSAYLAGFYAFKLHQKYVRDSVIFTKTQKIPKLSLENISQITPINLAHKIKINPNLWGLYDD
ncbi:MnmC family methyltransferase [uncultured Helicobacter sp.]|uniref:MnmC family methyltransferase n=1 Tax=uncultured Helicobacter sp. TaxID=175537 RepID=UPI00262EA3FC|nr:MnmC family methyltransferase [uncultured Helicobacter sp.]